MTGAAKTRAESKATTMKRMGDLQGLAGTERSASAQVRPRIPAKVLRQVLVVRLERAAADLEQLGVAPEPLDHVLAHVAVAAEHLDRGVGDALADLRGDELGGVGVGALAGLGEVDASRGVVHVVACGAPFRVSLREVALDLAVLADR